MRITVRSRYVLTVLPLISPNRLLREWVIILSIITTWGTTVGMCVSSVGRLVSILKFVSREDYRNVFYLIHKVLIAYKTWVSLAGTKVYILSIKALIIPSPIILRDIIKAITATHDNFYEYFTTILKEHTVLGEYMWFGIIALRQWNNEVFKVAAVSL